nr:SOS response-associated peptidase family protein [Xenophilus azovorans]
MCYSAAVRADFAAFRRLFPTARVDLKAFFDLYWRKKQQPKVLLTSKGMDTLFARPRTAEEREIHALILEIDAERARAYEQDLFKQRKRLADAERVLQVKPTKKAQEDQRIAPKKIAAALASLDAMKRAELRDTDWRLFPQWWGPVLLIEDGEPIIRPMRYLCRPAGKPVFYDTKYPGIYNARRDSLGGFWKGQFGHTHCLALVPVFWEHVVRHLAEHRELQPGEKPENIVLEFRPRPQRDQLVACIYSHWTPPAGSDEPDLWSFAAVTDEPLPEVAAAGHDRTIVALREENVQAWLTPQDRSLDELDALLEDKERPYYEFRMAA